MGTGRSYTLSYEEDDQEVVWIAQSGKALVFIRGVLGSNLRPTVSPVHVIIGRDVDSG